MSTETHLNAPLSRGAAGRPVTGRIPAPAPARDNGSISWDRPTSGDLTVVDGPQPRLRQMIGVCAWAAILGGLGLVIGIRGFIGDLLGLAPSWYEPFMIVFGIAGIGLTVSAFMTVQRARLPYLLLSIASVLLLGALALTVVAF